MQEIIKLPARKIFSQLVSEKESIKSRENISLPARMEQEAKLSQAEQARNNKINVYALMYGLNSFF